MTLMFNNQEVEIEEIEGEVGEGVYGLSAIYVETGLELTDEECDELRDLHADELYEQWYQDQVGAAEAYADFLQDR